MRIRLAHITSLISLLAVWLGLGILPAMAAAQGSQAKPASKPQLITSRDKAKEQRIRELLAEGLAAYRQKDVETAVARWREVLLIDPTNERASIYLKEVTPDYEQVVAARRQREQADMAETEARRKMAEKITIETKEGGARLGEFLRTLAFVTGIDFNIVGGADAVITAKFEDKSLADILDTVLLPNGLTWRRNLDIVTIMPELKTRYFRLDTDTFTNAQRLFETNELQRLLWNADTPPIRGVELNLDNRQSVLILTDSPTNLAKMENFLRELRVQPPPRLITRTYSVRSDIAQQVKILVEAMLKTETEPAYEQERKVLLAPIRDGFELVIKDTEENIRKVEGMLEDSEFLRHIEEEEIEVYTVNLTPRDVLTVNTEQVEAFARDVKEVIETMLYHKDGVTAAMALGRRLWFDPATLQMTLTDYPSNIRKVAEFIEALPQLEPKRRSKIIFLEYQIASDLAAQLEEILGISAGAAAGVAGGNQASFSLRVEDERIFRDLSIRLVRVDENNFGDDNDDSCELVVRTARAQSSDLNIPEYRSETFEQYEILVEEVDPSPTPGEGRVRLQVTYRPELGGGPAY